MWVFTSIAIIITLHSSLAESSKQIAQNAERERDYDVERLPTNVVPFHYTLDLEVKLPGYSANIPKEAEFTTSGQVQIDFTVTERTKILKLNIAETVSVKTVLFMTVTPEWKDGNWTKLNDVTINNNKEIMTIQLEEELLPAWPHKLVIFFDGKITNTSVGLYYVEHNSSHGIEYSAITQFEDIRARQMVPCFDEPSFKATWKLSVLHPMGTHAISNGELLHRVDLRELNKTVSVFETSPYMSSYLLALSVSNYIYETGYTKYGIRVRGFAHKSFEGKLLKEAVNYTVKSMEILEELFNYSPFQKKLDFVFTPSAYSGMENWGLITFNEHMLSTGLDSLHDGVVDVIAHEVTHQWFGNLVTAVWWSEVWLNEGLTTYVTCHIAEELRKEIKSDDCMFEMQKNSMASSHPLIVEVDTRVKIDAQFNTAYNKGGSLARMIEEIIGYSNMIEGLKNYINDHLYGNVDRYDLVDALQSFTDVNLTRLVDQWSTQVGYPFVHVDRLERTIFKLTQTVAASNGTRVQKFDIPIFIKNSKSGKIPILKADADHMFVMTDGEYPIINGNNAGGYRVDYGKGWDKMKEDGRLTPMERSKLKEDLRAIQLLGSKTVKDLSEFQQPFTQHNNPRMMKQRLGKRSQRF